MLKPAPRLVKTAVLVAVLREFPGATPPTQLAPLVHCVPVLPQVVCAEEVSGNKAIEQTTATASTTPSERNRAAKAWLRWSESLSRDDEAAARGEAEENINKCVINIERPWRLGK